jgi:4-amino-4-deoxy-L-arabinose transferase-like glycosyltransferase
VTQAAVRRLPRPALILLCAAYVLPGVFGRDPWKNADLAAFGQMLAMAEGRSSWLTPTLGGVPADTALLPHWLGALFIALTSPWLDPAFAARIPFALLLVLTLVALWYSCFALARTEAAQPLPFAFGGEAQTIDYARAIADACLLAFIATLGLLQLGHETTPELAQLAAVASVQWALAAAPYRGTSARVGIILAMPSLAGSGAPAMALMLGLAGMLICARSSYPQVRRFGFWVAGTTVLACALAWVLGAWSWRLATGGSVAQIILLGRQWLWFLWPAWPLAIWTLWRWRHHLTRRHLAVPLAVLGTALCANVAMGGSDRALMLGLPGIAVLAAFALPTLRRSTGSAIDWFSVFFFSLGAILIWVIYVAMHTGVPAKPAANVARLAPGFVPQFSSIALAVAIVSTLAWLWLVRWRTARQRTALWRSLVLPAGGVLLAWSLLMTLWLPLLDYARSYRAHVLLLARHIPAEACIAAPKASRALTAALEYHGRWRVEAFADPAYTNCPILLLPGTVHNEPATPSGWQRVAVERRPADKTELSVVFRRL